MSTREIMVLGVLVMAAITLGISTWSKDAHEKILWQVRANTSLLFALFLLGSMLQDRIG